MAKRKVTLKGAAAMSRRLKNLGGRYPDTIRSVLHKHAEIIMTISKTNFVPVDNNALRSSGFVPPVERRTGRLIVAELVFGGPSEPYAIAVHETPSEHDPPSWVGKIIKFNVGSSKYLERPLMNAVPTLARKMARDLALDKAAGGIG